MIGIYSPYVSPGLKDWKDELFEPVFVNENNPAEIVEYLMKRIKSINGIDEIIHKTRKREHMESRQWHMLFALRIQKMSTTKAGELYGKDHATAIHSRNKIIAFYQVDKQFRLQYITVINECLEYDKNIFDE